MKGTHRESFRMMGGKLLPAVLTTILMKGDTMRYVSLFGMLLVINIITACLPASCAVLLSDTDMMALSGKGGGVNNLCYVQLNPCVRTPCSGNPCWNCTADGFYQYNCNTRNGSACHLKSDRTGCGFYAVAPTCYWGTCRGGDQTPTSNKCAESVPSDDDNACP